MFCFFSAFAFFFTQYSQSRCPCFFRYLAHLVELFHFHQLPRFCLSDTVTQVDSGKSTISWFSSYVGVGMLLLTLPFMHRIGTAPHLFLDIACTQFYSKSDAESENVLIQLNSFKAR